MRGRARIDEDAQLLAQFADKGGGGQLARLDLAAGLHEGARAALAHQKEPAVVVADDRGGDADRPGPCSPGMA